MALELPRRLARFNRSVTNRVQGQYAWLLPPWLVMCHTGRRSGRRYRTPVIGFVRGRTLAVVVLYGEHSDWVQNVLAGGARVVRTGRTYELREPRLVDVRDADGRVALPALLGARLSGKLLAAELEGPLPGFGRGPA